MKKIDLICMAILLVGVFTLFIVTGSALKAAEEIPLTHCGAGQYFDTDNKTCLVKSSIQPETIVETKIVEKIITESIPLNTIRGLSDTQNIFVTYSGEDSIVTSQTCDGLTVLVNPVMTTERDGSFVLRDSVSGMTLYLDKAGAYQYDIATVPRTGEQLNTVGKELTRSGVYTVQCEEKTTQKKTETTRDVFYYDLELTNKDTVLRIDGDVGEIVKNKRSITGMIVLYENNRIQDHMQSFNINLSSSGEFFERVDVDGKSDSGKTWRDNKTYRVIISYDSQQITEDFRK